MSLFNTNIGRENENSNGLYKTINKYMFVTVNIKIIIFKKENFII